MILHGLVLDPALRLGLLLGRSVVHAVAVVLVLGLLFLDAPAFLALCAGATGRRLRDFAGGGTDTNTGGFLGGGLDARVGLVGVGLNTELALDLSEADLQKTLGVSSVFIIEDERMRAGSLPLRLRRS